MLYVIVAIFFGALSAILLWRGVFNSRYELHKIPNAHFSTPYSRLWLIWARWKDLENVKRIELHRRHGPIVRIGPREVAVNCIDGGVRLIYGGDFAKNAWYPESFFGTETPYMLTMCSKEAHSARKRMLSAVYSKSHIMNSAELENITTSVHSRLERHLQTWNSEGPVEVLAPMKACMMDITAPWLYGSEVGTDFLRDEAARDDFILSWTQVADRFFWYGEFYGLTNMLQMLGISPVSKTTVSGLQNVQRWGAKMTAKASKSYVASSTSRTGLYGHFRSHLEKTYATTAEDERNRTMSPELLDHAIASHDVGGITLTYAMYELSRHPDVQRRLRNELHTLRKHDTTADKSSHQHIEELPLLDAVLNETLRLHTPSPGPFPRVVPPQGCRLADRFDVPAGTIVSATAYTLHRNETVFPDPESWDPARWLDADEARLAEMRKWFWAFGSGARICIAMHFAIHVIKATLATIYTDHETELAGEGCLPQADINIFAAGPIGNSLHVKFRSCKEDDERR